MYTKRIINAVVTHSVSGFPAVGESIAVERASDSGHPVWLVKDLNGGVWKAVYDLEKAEIVVHATAHYEVLRAKA